MTAIAYTYNLATSTWTTPSGTAGTDWLPSLDFGTQPTWTITATGSLPPGFADAQTWSLAVARDWLSATTPMCRTSDGVQVSQTSGGISITAPLDTLTERFLRVVDGVGEGVRCWMQVVGTDASGTPCCMVTLPLLCRPALDPHGTAGPLPPIPTTNMTEAEVEAIAEQAAQEAVQEALDDYYDKTATDDLLDGKIGTAEKGAANGVANLDANALVPSTQLPVAGNTLDASGIYKIGVVRMGSNKDVCGINITAYGGNGGYISINKASNNTIDDRSATHNSPIVPSNLDYAVRSVVPNVTAIPAATSAYSLLDATATTNNHSWQYKHAPTSAPTYTLPAVTDNTVAHAIDLKVKFSADVLTYSFVDSSSAAITPVSQPEIAAGTVVDFLCEYDPLSSQWVVMPLVMVEGGAS